MDLANSALSDEGSATNTGANHVGIHRIWGQSPPVAVAASQSPPCQCRCLRYPSRRVDFFWHIDVLCNAQLFQHKHWGLVPAKDQLKTLRDDDLVAVFQPSCWRWQHRGRRDGCHLQKRARLASILHAGKKQLYVHKFQQKSRS